jgi:hypothetical protein
MKTGNDDDDDPELDYSDVIGKAMKAVEAMQEALEKEQNFSRAGVPAIAAQKMLTAYSQAYVVAVMEAGRLMPSVLDELAKFVKVHEFYLSDLDLDIARVWAGSKRSSKTEVGFYFNMDVDTINHRIEKIYEKTGTRSRIELFYALKLKGMLD